MKLEAQVDLIEKKEEELESTLCTVMISKNMKSIKRTNGIMVIAGQKHEFFIKPETKEDFFKYLRKSGEGYLISTSVNYQTLQGHMNRLLEKSLIEKSAEKTVKALKPFLDERTRNQLTVKGLKGKQ